MIDISALGVVEPLFAKELVPKSRGIYFWIDRSSGNIVYIGIAVGVNGLYHRVVRQHLNPQYIEYRPEKQTSLDFFQLEFPVQKIVKGELKDGIDKSAFRKNIGRKLSIKPGTEVVNFIHNNLYLKFYVSHDIKEIKNLEKELIKKYQPCFNVAFNKKKQNKIKFSTIENVNFGNKPDINVKDQNMNLNEKQDQELVNTLITIAESSSNRSISVESKNGTPTVASTLFEVLKNHPYEFKQSELFYEVHVSRLKKDPEQLKLASYKLQRSELCSLYGWGIHGDKTGKLALVPCDTKFYELLFNDTGIKKKKAYNK